MRPLDPRWFLLSVGIVAAACAPSIPTPTYQAAVFPSVAHSGFNTNATFKVMFSTAAADPTWAIDDVSIATIAPSARPTIKGTDVSNLQFALVTTTKPGDTTVRMVSRDGTVTAQLVVKAYTDDQLASGKARYTTPSTDPARPPCASCHTADGGVGVDHSPLKMAGFDDDEILGVIEQATYPASPTGGSTTSAFSPKGPLKFTGHKWNLTTSERDGIIAYLRSLPLGGL